MIFDRPFWIAPIAVVIAILPAAPGRQTSPASGAGDASKLEVSVPAFPNSTCPIMGKPISRRLFVDTDFGRIYVCCKGCNEKILADVPTAYKAAYPRTQKLENKVCPVSGREVARDAPTVLLQGREVALCDAEHAPAARERAQVVLAKAADPALVEVGNETCPITEEPVEKNTFCVIDGRVVHLATPQCVDEAKKDPKRTLEKALESRPGPAGGAGRG